MVYSECSINVSHYYDLILSRFAEDMNKAMKSLERLIRLSLYAFYTFRKAFFFLMVFHFQL